MTAIAVIAMSPPRTAQFAHWIKWIASIVQIVGYSATAFGWTPWSIHMFLIGLIGWFIVGILWRDRAIILIHVIALAAMVARLVSR